MALTSALMKRLNEDGEPLSKRLKLAENALYSEELPIVRKEDIILQWICEKCIIDENSWDTLQSCLKCDHLNIKFDVKKKLVKILTDELQKQEEKMKVNIIQCCDSIFSNVEMHQYFINEPDELGTLTKKILQYILLLYKDIYGCENYSKNGVDLGLIHSSNSLFSTIYALIPNIIENIIQIYKQATITKNELRYIFLNDILYALCDIIDHNCTNSTNRLGAVTHKCLQQFVFLKQKYLQLNTDNDSSNFEPFNIVFSILSKNNIIDRQSNVVTYVFIFRTIFGTYKNESHIVDSLCRGILNAANEYKKNVLHSIFEYLNDISFDFQHKVKEVTLLEYFVNILEEILQIHTWNKIDYDIIIQMSNFNPLIIEKKLQNILVKAIIENSSVHYEKLLIALLDATVKLRKEQKLISQLLMSLQQLETINYDKKTNSYFPCGFLKKVSEVVKKNSVSENVNILKTLIYHLNENYKNLKIPISRDKCLFMMKAITELIISFLEETFEINATRNSQQKLIKIFNELNQILKAYTEFLLKDEYDNEVTVMLLKTILSLDQRYNKMSYYLSNEITGELDISVTEEQWQNLTEKVIHSGNEKCKFLMNKISIVRSVSSHPTERRIQMKNLIGGLNSSWKDILMWNLNVVKLMTEREIFKLTNLLVSDIMSNENDIIYWSEVFKKDIIQENNYFILSFLYTVLQQIGMVSKSNEIQTLVMCISMESLIESQNEDVNKIKTVLGEMKDKISNHEFTTMETVEQNQLFKHLKILEILPLSHLNSSIKTVIFLVLYSVIKKSNYESRIITLSNKIFTDILNNSNIDVFFYIEPTSLIHEIKLGMNISKAITQSLRHVTSYSVLENLIKSCKNDKFTKEILFECIHNVKSKVDSHQKNDFKEAEKLLYDSICETLSHKTKKCSNIKTLTILLKVGISFDKLNENLKQTIETIFSNLFVSNNISTIDNEIIHQAFELSIIILRNHTKFTIPDLCIRKIWDLMLISVHKELLSALLESTSPQELPNLLQILQLETTLKLKEENLDALENIFTIWILIMKTDMSAKRNKCRMAALDDLFQNIVINTVSEKYYIYFLKLYEQINRSKYFPISNKIIDMSIIICLRSLSSDNISVCSEALKLSSVILLTRTDLVTDKLPSLLLIYRHIMRIIINTSKTVDDQVNEDYYRCLAVDLEKFTISLVKLKKDVARLSPYLIADILKLFSEGAIPLFIKQSLENCIAQLLSISDKHSSALLSRALPLSLQELFKRHLNTYNKFYKYTGKI